MNNLLSGFADMGMAAAFVPMTLLMIPIIAILVKHQQRMTEIIHRSQMQQGSDPQIALLQEEVRQLRQQVAMLALEQSNKPKE